MTQVMTSGSALDVMAERSRSTSAVFVNKALIEGLGVVTKITFGEALLSQADQAAGLTQEHMFQPRTAIVMNLQDLLAFKDALQAMFDHIDKAGATANNEP